MKRLYFALMLLCIALGANAQLLWKISGNGLSKPSYVFGTHHLAPISIVEEVKGFNEAMNGVDQLYGEIVMSEMNQPESVRKVQQTIAMPEGTTLHTLYSSAQYDSLAVVVKNLMGADLAVLDKMKPSFISSQLALLLAMKTVKGFNPQVQLDAWLQIEAGKKGKKVGGLETMDFQMKTLFCSQPLERQAEQLYYSFSNLEFMEAQTQQLTDAYMQQKLGDVKKVMDIKAGNAADALPEEEDVMIYNRNSNWAVIMPLIMKGASTMFVVGVGHLPGERGLLNLLKQQGYSIEAVK